MKGKRLILAVAVLLAVSLSCGRRKTAAPVVEKPLYPDDFPMIEIPSLLTDGAQRLDFFCGHFWDRFLDVKDVPGEGSERIRAVSREKLESAVGMYATTMRDVPLRQASSYIASLSDRLDTLRSRDSTLTVADTVISLISRYFYDPNSPVRDEDLYGVFARKLSSSPFTPDSLRGALSADAYLCSLNSKGSRASDFRFRKADGRVSSLYSVKAGYTLLFFSNPGCTACREITQVLSHNPHISRMLSEGTLAVVNIYIDKEIDTWRGHIADYPSEWITGYDYLYAIREKLLYNVRAIPSLYLLDSGKVVLLKDAPVEVVAARLESIDI